MDAIGLLTLLSKSSSRLFYQNRNVSFGDLFHSTQLMEKTIPHLAKEKSILVWEGENNPLAIQLLFLSLKNNTYLYPTRFLDKETRETLRFHRSLLVFKKDNHYPEFFKKTGDFEKVGDKDTLKGSGLIIKTSGTSGKAKYTLISPNMIYQNAKNVKTIIGLSPKQMVIVTSSFRHTSGWNALLLPAVIFNLNIVLEVKFNVFSSVRLMNELKNNIIHLSPIQAELLTKTKTWKDHSLQTEKVIIGTSHVSARIILSFLKSNINVVKNFGLTEAGPYILYKKFECGDTVMSSDLYEMGSFPDNVSSRFVKRNDFPMYSELFLKGPVIFGGYLGRETPASDWFATGDLFRVEKEGVYYSCRTKDLQFVDGKTFAPDEVESKLLDYFCYLSDCSIVVKGANGKSVCILNVVSKKSCLDPVQSYVCRLLSVDQDKVILKRLKRLNRNPSGKLVR